MLNEHVKVPGPAWLQVATKALEADSATLDLVLFMLGQLVKHFKQVADSSLGQLMVTALEKRWATYD